MQQEKAYESNKCRFLLARYHVERVLVCRSVDEIYKCLDTLPERLDDYYEQCWQRATCEGSSHKRTLAHHILMWVTLAEQPLSLQALIQAARISTDNDSGLKTPIAQPWLTFSSSVLVLLGLRECPSPCRTVVSMNVRYRQT
jgi:hypothetical protein